MKAKNTYHVIGLMSGTSLDGLDVVYCTLRKENRAWMYKIHKAITVKYTASWKKKLSTAHLLSASELLALDVAYGNFLGRTSADFISKYKIAPLDFISSHGHTIFHQPERGFTYQLGSGLALHESSRVPAVCDFRSLDVSRGGQGAPLVPVGDRYLFGKFDCCVNLGGIANLSMEGRNGRIAFDFCFVNMGLNYLMSVMNKAYDKNGTEASHGKVNTTLLHKLTSVNKKWRSKRPSLGREFFEKDIQPLLGDETISINDRLRTFCESIAVEFEEALPVQGKNNLQVLITGGGALNSFLMKCITGRVDHRANLVIPSDDILKFKEGLIFALLGVLRVRNEVNSLKTVTGARRDSSGGVMIGF